MNTQRLIDDLLEQPELTTQKKTLSDSLSQYNEEAQDELADGLKRAFDKLLSSDLNRSKQILDLLHYLSERTENPFHLALALRAKGNYYMLGIGEPVQSIPCYNQAADIYRDHQDQLNEVGALVGKVAALANLGQFNEAMAIYHWADTILSAHGQWLLLAGVTLNLTIAYNRLGDDFKALEMANRAKILYTQAGKEGEAFIPWVENNRAAYLCNLGHFKESIKASKKATYLLNQLEQSALVAYAEQTMAFTYFVLGRYNEAMSLFNQVKESLMTDNRLHDAILVEIDSSDLLLKLGRFPEVIEKCRKIRTELVGPDKHILFTRAMLNEGLAYTGLRRYQEALSSLKETRNYFEKQSNDIWIAITDMAIASVLYLQKKFDSCLAIAQTCADLFSLHNLPLRQADAYLLTARAARELKQYDYSFELAAEALNIGQLNDIPLITYQSYYLLGSLANLTDEKQKAYQSYQAAIKELERQRGQIMVEYRSDFLADKRAIYEDLVKLCLDLGETKQAFQYAERAKSRALLDLLAYRLDVSLKPRSNNDIEIIEEMETLRAERDRLYRRWESRRIWEENRDVPEGEWSNIQKSIVAAEKEITEKWHALLIRNAGYAREAALWQVRNEEVQPYLDADSILIEYFVIHNQLYVFLVTSGAIEVRILSAKLPMVKRYWNMLRMNLSTVPKSNTKQIQNLSASAKASSLRPLYQLLVAPLQDKLASYTKLIIVPHDVLHYLPFHAFHNGQQFLLEQYEVSYLPSASVLRYACEVEPVNQQVVAFGYSHQGHLPGRVSESLSIATIMQGQAFVEEEATLDQVRQSANQCRILHLATHGYFYQNNSLFSGLMLADGYLTTLEIFNLRLNASLVTLSGCQTGQSAIGGGDELLGLMRAFLYAGSASLVLTHWAVEDQSTALLMQIFYQKLSKGWSKGKALRHAQLQLLASNHHEVSEMKEIYAHPYFWASCFMVGDTGNL